MTTIDELNQSKIPVIVFDKNLEQFRDKVLLAHVNFLGSLCKKFMKSKEEKLSISYTS